MTIAARIRRARVPRCKANFFLRLLEGIFDQMQLAGEAGSLYGIEENIRSAIADAKQLWKEAPALEQSKLFAELEIARQGTLAFDLSGITDELFWDTAEGRIYAALRDYAEHVENGGGLQHQLFALDASRGFAFIDVCRKRYDVALMNPPFGVAPPSVYRQFERIYPDSYTELYACFVERAVSLCQKGAVGAITSRGFLTMMRLTEWRRCIAIPRMSALL